MEPFSIYKFRTLLVDAETRIGRGCSRPAIRSTRRSADS
jgi:hypothetical protein